MYRAIPNGIHGIEERLHIAWEELVNAGLISRSDFVRLTSTQAAKIFNIYPQKGVIAPGSDADIIIFDPDLTHTLSAKTHFSNIDTNIWEGRRITGKVCESPQQSVTLMPSAYCLLLLWSFVACCNSC